MNDGVSLRDIIMKQSGAMRPQERYNLFITLTSSLLQLSHTPWFQETWSKTDILFFRANDGYPSSGITVDVRHPYLTREYKNSTALIRQNISQPFDSIKIVALGVMLLNAKP